MASSPLTTGTTRRSGPRGDDLSRSGALGLVAHIWTRGGPGATTRNARPRCPRSPTRSTLGSSRLGRAAAGPGRTTAPPPVASVVGDVTEPGRLPPASRAKGDDPAVAAGGRYAVASRICPLTGESATTSVRSRGRGCRSPLETVTRRERRPERRCQPPGRGHNGSWSPAGLEPCNADPHGRRHGVREDGPRPTPSSERRVDPVALRACRRGPDQPGERGRPHGGSASTTRVDADRPSSPEALRRVRATTSRTPSMVVSEAGVPPGWRPPRGPTNPQAGARVQGCRPGPARPPAVVPTSSPALAPVR